MKRDELRKLLERDPEAILDLIETLFARIEEIGASFKQGQQEQQSPALK